MKEEKVVGPQAIAPRDRQPESRPADKAKALPENRESRFAELKLSFGTPAFAPSAQRIPTQVIDEKRQRLQKMRAMASAELSLLGNTAKTFYYQAKFMEDFTDDYEQAVPLSLYYPCYSLMSYDQLRTYFTWRTAVRAGEVTGTSLSYAFLYIYELLHNIGTDGPEDGLAKLMSFWQAYRAYDEAIDKYLLEWVKDYHIYYPLARSFHDFAAEHGLQKNYPKVFAYSAGPDEAFALFCGIAKYDIRKSIFYTEQRREKIADCFFYVLERFRALFAGKARRFEDYIFHPVTRPALFKPFASALFYPYAKQEPRTVVLSEREQYTYEAGRFTYTTVILTDEGRKLLGALMKEMEGALRRAEGFKHRLKPGAEMYAGPLNDQLAKKGLTLSGLVGQAVSDYLRVQRRHIVTVDEASLRRIRTAARHTQERLTLPDAADGPAGSGAGLADGGFSARQIKAERSEQAAPTRPCTKGQTPQTSAPCPGQGAPDNASTTLGTQADDQSQAGTRFNNRFGQGAVQASPAGPAQGDRIQKIPHTTGIEASASSTAPLQDPTMDTCPAPVKAALTGPIQGGGFQEALHAAGMNTLANATRALQGYDAPHPPAHTNAALQDSQHEADTDSKGDVILTGGPAGARVSLDISAQLGPGQASGPSRSEPVGYAFTPVNHDEQGANQSKSGHVSAEKADMKRALPPDNYRMEENDGSQLQDGPVVGQPKHIQPAPDGLQPVGTAAGRVQHAPLLFAPPAPEGGNVWERLRGALSEAETQMLRAALHGGDAKAAARQQGAMLEVLAEGINEKAVDIVGDVLLEIGDTAAVYEEYREDLLKVME